MSERDKDTDLDILLLTCELLWQWPESGQEIWDIRREAERIILPSWWRFIKAGSLRTVMEERDVTHRGRGSSEFYSHSTRRIKEKEDLLLGPRIEGHSTSGRGSHDQFHIWDNEGNNLRQALGWISKKGTLHSPTTPHPCLELAPTWIQPPNKFFTRTNWTLVP